MALDCVAGRDILAVFQIGQSLSSAVSGLGKLRGNAQLYRGSAERAILGHANDEQPRTADHSWLNSSPVVALSI